MVRQFTGELAGDGREGRLKWWPIQEPSRIPMPEADRRFFPPVVLGTEQPYERTFHYDAELRLLPT